jgi:hypothetical protein
MKIIFLDFDGVLHPSDVWLEGGAMRLGDVSVGHSLLEHAASLANLLAPFDDAKVVLSTSWVSGLGFDYAFAQLPKSLARRVIGATFDPARHGADFGAVARGYQVQDDVRRRGLTDWMALDDDARDWPEEDLSRLIQTNPVHGFRSAGVMERLEAWLDGRAVP